MKSWFVFVGLFLSISCFVLSAEESVDAEIQQLKRTSRAFTSIARKAIPAVVAITGEMDIQERYPRLRPSPYPGFYEWYYGDQGYEAQGRQIEQGGTGFIISEDGYILTNNHVVKDADRIKVRLNDGRVFIAEKIGSDPRSEVALIKIKAGKLPFLELGDSAGLEIGEWVIAIGNQFGFFSESLTVGVVSAKGRSNLALAEYEDFIQTDAAINPGNSGGPLLDIDGKVVGINTAIYSQSGGYMGIGFAIPINMAKAIKDQLIKNDGRIVRGYLGVRFNPREIDQELAESFGMAKAEGALVADVMEGTPADKAGIKAGDVILELDGKRIAGIRVLMSTIALMPPGSKVKAKVFRDGAAVDLDITIGVYPGDELVDGEGGGLAGRIGLAVEEFSAQTAMRFGYGAEEGVIISGVADNSLAAQAELVPGLLVLSVNRQRVSSVAEFSEALKESAVTGRVLLRVKSPDYTWFVLIPLDQEQVPGRRPKR